MSYREKIAWLSLAVIALTAGPYFVHVARTAPPDAVPNLPLLGLLALALGGKALLAGGGRLWLWLRSPRHERAWDERDQAIERRAMGLAYGVLIAGVIVAGCVLPFERGGWAIVNAAVLAIVLAEVVHYGAVAWAYRRGAA